MSTVFERLADVPAQQAEIGIVVDNPYGAAVAVQHGVTAEHFTVTSFSLVFAAAIERVDLESLEERVTAIANIVGIDVDYLMGLVLAPRRTMRDLDGAYARRVIAAAERVAQYRAHVAGLEALGIGVAA